MNTLTVPHYVVKLDRLLDDLLEDEPKDTQFHICEVLWKLDLVTRDETICRDEDGMDTKFCFYVSTEGLQDLWKATPDWRERNSKSLMTEDERRS